MKQVSMIGLIGLIGLDLAKNVFAVRRIDG